MFVKIICNFFYLPALKVPIDFFESQQSCISSQIQTPTRLALSTIHFFPFNKLKLSTMAVSQLLAFCGHMCADEERCRRCVCGVSAEDVADVTADAVNLCI